MTDDLGEAIAAASLLRARLAAEEEVSFELRCQLSLIDAEKRQESKSAELGQQREVQQSAARLKFAEQELEKSDSQRRQLQEEVNALKRKFAVQTASQPRKRPRAAPPAPPPPLARTESLGAAAPARHGALAGGDACRRGELRACMSEMVDGIIYVIYSARSALLLPPPLASTSDGEASSSAVAVTPRAGPRARAGGGAAGATPPQTLTPFLRAGGSGDSAASAANTSSLLDESALDETVGTLDETDAARSSGGATYGFGTPPDPERAMSALLRSARVLAVELQQWAAVERSALAEEGVAGGGRAAPSISARMGRSVLVALARVVARTTELRTRGDRDPAPRALANATLRRALELACVVLQDCPHALRALVGGEVTGGAHAPLRDEADACAARLGSMFACDDVERALLGLLERDGACASASPCASASVAAAAAAAPSCSGAPPDHPLLTTLLAALTTSREQLDACTLAALLRTMRLLAELAICRSRGGGGGSSGGRLAACPALRCFAPALRAGVIESLLRDTSPESAQTQELAVALLRVLLVVPKLFDAACGGGGGGGAGAAAGATACTAPHGGGALLARLADILSAAPAPVSGGSSGGGARGVVGREGEFFYRYILRESSSQFDSLPLTSLTNLWRGRRARRGGGAPLEAPSRAPPDRDGGMPPRCGV